MGIPIACLCGKLARKTEDKTNVWEMLLVYFSHPKINSLALGHINYGIVLFVNHLDVEAIQMLNMIVFFSRRWHSGWSRQALI